jgi:orotate phosphoribosyltransferase
MHEDLLSWVAARNGHFALESGHHGERWLDLELLCLRPERVQPVAVALAARLRPHDVEAVCGPLIEGAFIALLVAAELGVPFTYAVPVPSPEPHGLFPVSYRIPRVIHPELQGRRVAVVNDVVGAGSAVRGTMRDLDACGARTVVLATLAVLGPSAAALAAERNIALETLAAWSGRIWTPAECPMCAGGVPLTGVAAH